MRLAVAGVRDSDDGNFAPPAVDDELLAEDAAREAPLVPWRR